MLLRITCAAIRVVKVQVCKNTWQVCKKTPHIVPSFRLHRVEKKSQVLLCAALPVGNAPSRAFLPCPCTHGVARACVSSTCVSSLCSMCLSTYSRLNKHRYFSLTFYELNIFYRLRACLSACVAVNPRTVPRTK